MRRWLFTLLPIVGIIAAYLLVWPVPIAARAWVVKPDAGYTGAHAVNTGLAGLQALDLGGEEGPEHVQMGTDGRLYADW